MAKGKKVLLHSPKTTSGSAPTQRMEKFVDLRGWESGTRTDLKEFERATAEQPTQKMTKFKDLRFEEGPSGQPAKTTVQPKVGEKTVIKKPPKISRFKLPLKLGPLTAVTAVGLILGTVVFIMANRALEKTQEKIGQQEDLSRYLPQNNKVIQINVPFTRVDREAAPYFEPNIVAEILTVDSPANNIFAFGVLLEGVPELFTNDVNINELGEGNSDWLCESFKGYLICRSMSLSYPLEKDKISEITLFFHLPGYEVDRMLQTRSGSRPAYLIVGKK